ncbi:Phage integrase family protein [Flexibacter flexilis DSM 6793]|uniref:Phage integrase family protein n=1 Tax=Flexibacter flexilis DSM 6793 TaxID=927664 RepID=A0A1I1MGP3_9BACT|nr:tyrosine-type recombinase/integrase [Flexibacter flexilis]SFC84671.1 Phage integrase family protein [Flexibacter flexilis DSM 6793]
MTVYVFHRTDQTNKRGEAPVCAYVIIDGKKSGNFALGLVCTPEALGSSVVQGQIALAKKAIEDIHTFLSLSQKTLTANDIKTEYITRKKGNRVKVIQTEGTLLKVSEVKPNLCFFRIARQIGEMHVYLLRFERFANSHPEYSTNIYEIRPLVMSYLSQFTKRNTDTASVYFQRIKQVVVYALEEGIIQKNPLRGVKILRKKGEKLSYLKPEHINQIIDYKGFLPKLMPYVDLFLFACYTGLSLSDCVNVSQENIVAYGTREYIVARRQKSKSLIRTELTDVAKSVWAKHEYKWQTYLDYNSKSFRSQYYLILLTIKKIRQITGQSVTFHKARHTKAFELLNVRGASIDMVSTMLGHTNVTITQKYYAEMSLEGLSKALDKLEE